MTNHKFASILRPKIIELGQRSPVGV